MFSLYEERDEYISSKNLSVIDSEFNDILFIWWLIAFQSPLAEPWIIPIMQGYVQIEKCQLEFDEESPDSYKDPLHSPIDPTLQYTITLISRRSRYRAGKNIS